MTTKNRAKKFSAKAWSVENPRTDRIDCYLEVKSQDKVAIFVRDANDPTFFDGIVMPRRKARLLAKRINQMLDEML